MKKFYLTIFVVAMLTNIAFSQNLTQTVRGNITDTDSKLPLIFVTVFIPGTDPLIGAVTDLDGNYRLENVPIGRITLQFSYMGYEDKTIPNIEVNSGKEVVLNINMLESAVQLEEVVVSANKNKGEALNDMALISARSISVEETKRYAGGFDDPSRVASNFAGVANTPDGSSDLIIRGNNSKYMQWRIEGMETSNPYHFNSSFGGLSILNNNLLAASDFYTGAYSSEYGDVLSGVFDVNLRAGNNEKFESAFGIGVLGMEATLEGPFKKSYSGSYLANYRYSTTSLIADMGLIDVGGTPKYQDGTFKVVLPTKKAGNFSVYGVGGLSSFLMKNIKPDLWITPGNEIMKENTSEDMIKLHARLIQV